MKNPFVRKTDYDSEHARLLEWACTLDPTSDEYAKLMKQIDNLDQIRNRTTEIKKTIIPALATIGSIGGVYALQQFGGVLIPKALDAIASRSQQKH